MIQFPANQKPEFYPGQLISWQQDGNVIELQADNAVILRVEVLNDEILRFRYSTTGYFAPDFSYAISESFSSSPARIRINETKRFIRLVTASVICHISKSGLKIQMSDSKGNRLCEDEKGFHWEESKDGGDIVQMSKKAAADEAYYGLGDKSGSLNLRGQRLQNWNTDCFGYGASTDPLYRSIPFYMGLTHGAAYGLFFDNSFRTYFDFAKERHDTTSFWAHGGEMNYYFFYGPDLLSVAARYAHLTGTAELPPLWAMGYHQCRWSYYPEKRVKEIASAFREHKIPCDALYLDIDYMDGYRCFTWDYDRFPNPRGLIRELKDDGFRTVVIIDPGIKIDMDNEVFMEGLEKDYYCKWPDGPLVKGKVWPGDCYFPDYTKPEVREWWAGLFKDLIRREGVSGIWNDMNEPALFDTASKTFSEEILHDYDGNICSHRKAHNVYGMQMSRATYEGVRRFAYPNRPLMITRASYSGGQRYASVWTGDNVSSWEHLRLANIQCQRLSISGFSFVGTDIGGFNAIADGELLVRWLQAAMLHPLYRNHTMGNNIDGAAEVDDTAVEAKALKFNTDQEPWAYGEPYTSLAREAIEMRYRFLPYLYTAFRQHVETGKPVLRPLSFLDQQDPETYNRMEEFGVGDHLLVCPISEEGATSRKMYLPSGTWYAYDHSIPQAGKCEIEVDAPLNKLPIYIRAGAVIPQRPVMQFVDEFVVEELTLRVYNKLGQEKSECYEDAGDGFDYQEGTFLLRTFELNGTEKSLRLNQHRSGSYESTVRQFRVLLYGFSGTTCQVDGEEVSVAQSDEPGSPLEFVIPAGFGLVHLT